MVLSKYLGQGFPTTILAEQLIQLLWLNDYPPRYPIYSDPVIIKIAQSFQWVYWRFRPWFPLSVSLGGKTVLLIWNVLTQQQSDHINQRHVFIRDLKIQRRGRRRERQKNNRFYKQNNSFARTSHFFCTFLSRFCTTTT